MSSAGVAFLGALQAALSVLLTISVGVVSAQFGLVSPAAAEELSHLCVNLLLPCLLIINIGKNLHLDTIGDYVPMVIWAAIYTLLSIAIGRVLTMIFRLPKWATPAIAFNNTESLPLLLLQALGMTGVLSTLTGGGDESDAVERARSYFLAASVITNTITFGQGPQILQRPAKDSTIAKVWRWLVGSSGIDDYEIDDQENQRGEIGDEEQSNDQQEDRDDDSEGDNETPDEDTSLLPTKVKHSGSKAKHMLVSRLNALFYACPKAVQRVLAALAAFINPPFIGAAIGIVIGLTPALRRLFFNDMSDGGYFNAWLTACLKNVGDLFVSLQVVIVGVKLSLSLRRWKSGDNAGTVPLGAFISIVFVRFVFWPAISIPLIWALAAYTDALPSDPILCWSMMMLPVGPSAMKLLALADVSGVPQKVRMAIARFLTLSYMITPLIAVAVVGALKAADSAHE